MGKLAVKDHVELLDWDAVALWDLWQGAIGLLLLVVLTHCDATQEQSQVSSREFAGSGDMSVMKMKGAAEVSENFGYERFMYLINIQDRITILW